MLPFTESQRPCKRFDGSIVARCFVAAGLGLRVLGFRVWGFGVLGFRALGFRVLVPNLRSVFEGVPSQGGSEKGPV